MSPSLDELAGRIRKLRTSFYVLLAVFAAFLLAPGFGLLGKALDLIRHLMELTNFGQAVPTRMANELSQLILSTVWGVALSFPILLALIVVAFRWQKRQKQFYQLEKSIRAEKGPTFRL
ncbi:MAG: MotA/TolQ/ExbB proton channel family protein [Verrucomicrobiota bacterium JB023]|nr:MotA/TolQ/ExbB proton channel family protein [Verrucomicrobiota bacterium JB023]